MEKVKAPLPQFGVTLYTAISLGGGVQSSVLALVSAKTDLLPTVDAAIFADTGSEHPETYKHLEWLQREITEFPVATSTRNGRHLGDDVVSGVNEYGYGEERYGKPYFSIPLYTEDGKLTRRTCTAQYKIYPVIQGIRRHVLGLKPRQHIRKGDRVIQWLGISTDEIHRMKPTSKKPWLSSDWPLITRLGWSRNDCQTWFEDNYPARTLRRSACTFCPFQSSNSWREIHEEGGEVWEEVVRIDKALRLPDGSKGYLHYSLLPIEEAVQNINANSDLWGNECEGVCGV